MNIYTIGFTQKSAEEFFTLIASNNIKRIVDVRINNTSQLSGFAKRDDLSFFLSRLTQAEYVHLPELAPTKELLATYQKKKLSWTQYEEEFLNLMARRNIEKNIKINDLYDGCLLCSEHKPHQCHRRLVLEYLAKYSETNFQIKHLY
ncbi:DUF488 family protein [Aeromonas hydrophila]|uniref:DUF488 domain-containing protein n=1 Tax=Aeromonas hydrophila TaxID=644 RepID=UPI001A8D0081|nr:DUF488 domain-containing protein [Aeromonas hydrophila]MBQ4668774.1 DUF488 family protein [Aeromonas hydrophila]MBQ4716978.1 DUF488 family protein [Aeromonas hydrophila]MBW3826097.1 DUF488 family protein [Aeromonas hydrophila]MBW5271286.1 DUF488 family protein [Aeromonas hydrophila]QSR53746.1 DUF488 domain-containing protein [Aeromonas hydrophila]